MAHDKFDEKSLFERKYNNFGFKYCPVCGSPFIERKLDHKLRLQCGNDGCGYVYYHNPTPAAGAMIVDDRKILLVKRSAPPKIGSWCLPAGFMEFDEHPSQTAVRELKEETGLDIQIDRLFDVYSGNDDPRTNAVLILYLARITGGKLAAGDDAAEVRFFKLTDLPGDIAFASHRQALADYIARFPESE